MSVFLNTFFLLLVVGLALAAVRMRDLVGSVLALAAYGFTMSLVWAGLGAVDVAFTEAVVGAGATTVFFLATLLRTVPREESTSRRHRGVSLAALFLVGGLLLLATHEFPAWGDPASPPSRHVSPRYLEQGYQETGAPNIVTAVLADYRGYDTLVETVVIFTGGLACWLLLQRREP